MKNENGSAVPVIVSETLAGSIAAARETTITAAICASQETTC
jgi:hypothetical protein